MHFSLHVIGKMTNQALRAATDDYAKRLPNMISINEYKESGHKNCLKRKQEEAKMLLSKSAMPLIALDETGDLISSQKIASFIAENARTHFIIGGADGLDQNIRDKATKCWSLGKITLPHQMARMVLIEQLYRAVTINNGHPYHRS